MKAITDAQAMNHPTVVATINALGEIADELRAELATLKAQEPVAWSCQLGSYAHIEWGSKRRDDNMHTIPLYLAAGAQKEQA